MSWRERGIAYGLATFAGVLTFLGFAGFDLWPLAFVAFVPLFVAIDRVRPFGGFAVLRLAVYFGFVADWGGYYWLVEMMKSFSGFSVPLCIFFASILILYTGGSFGLFGWLWARARDRGYNITIAAVCALLACEFVYPLLFPFFYGASFHMLPVLLQIADLGGALLLTALAISVNAAIYELVEARLRKATLPWKAPAATFAFVAFTLIYGVVRIDQIDARTAAAPKQTIAMVQANMGIFAKREDADEGDRRHRAQSAAIERELHPDLIVWPESGFAHFLPRDVQNVSRSVFNGQVHTPVLFGGLSLEFDETGGSISYNTAYMTDGLGNVRGTYDKTYLLAFGEYIPFGDVFPSLYRISANSGHFTRGSHVRALPLGEYRVSTLICYEDIIPSFVRRAVTEVNPHVLINITNDAWFGNTHEPWIHFALAKFRAVEHHRFLLRATNSGVSGVMDASGRVVTHSGVFTQENLHAEVAMLQGSTVYETLGDWPGWLSLVGILWMAFRRKFATARST
jgi:apolipoprotein N-acyltransferase